MPDKYDLDRTDLDPTPARKGVIREAIHNAIPNHFNDPVGLALRIVRSGNRDAIAALLQAGIRLGLSPVDIMLSRIAGRTEDCGTAPTRPVLFVTGPPRSGTTLLHQLLIRNLPVAYVTNLASLLPRSAQAGAFPLTAAIANEKVRLESYYGRTRALFGPSDGLEFWDRWFGDDRRTMPTQLTPVAAASMGRFFARLEQGSGRPVVAKNNNLIASAHLVADAMPTARFVCLRRDPIYLAQSLLKARNDIHGSRDISYGIDESNAAAAKAADPLEDVWRQVDLYQDLQDQQVKRLGPDRFMVVSYEELCADPQAVVARLGRTTFDLDCLGSTIEPMRASRKRSLTEAEFSRLTEMRDARRGSDQKQ